MKLISIFISTIVFCIGLVGCSQNSEPIGEDEFMILITAYKKNMYTIDVENLYDEATILKGIKPYMTEEAFNRDVKNGVYVYPQRFAKQHQKKIQLNNVKIDTVEENNEESTVVVKYTLLLTIDNSEVEKSGEMTVIVGDDNTLMISNDYEKPVTVDDIRFF